MPIPAPRRRADPVRMPRIRRDQHSRAFERVAAAHGVRSCRPRRTPCALRTCCPATGAGALGAGRSVPMHALPYVIVLAGGEGQRLAPLTRALYGTDLPKQFAVLSGERSLMQTTIERATALTTLDRISVVVTAHHENIARAQLAPYPGVELVIQPRNLDTGPGLLLPLVRILARAESARVVFLPSDHHVSNPAPIAEALRQAGADGLDDRISLLGVMPTGPEVEYGWIIRGTQIGGTGGENTGPGPRGAAPPPR